MHTLNILKCEICLYSDHLANRFVSQSSLIFILLLTCMITLQQEDFGRWIVLLCSSSAPVQRPDYAVATHEHLDEYKLCLTIAVADIQRRRKHVFMMDFQAQTIQRRLYEI